MSVHGEFDRYLLATIEALRASGSPEHVGCADALEREVGPRDASLEQRARRVLDGPLGQTTGEEPARQAAGGPAEALVSIARIILGVGPAK